MNSKKLTQYCLDSTSMTIFMSEFTSTNGHSQLSYIPFKILKQFNE